MMGLFGKSKKPLDRFPSERLSYLPIGLTAQIMTLATEYGFERESLMTCRFTTGYLMGYPDYVEDIDVRLGGIVRQMLFDGVFGAEEGGEMFQRCMGHMLLDDQQTRRGWGSGVIDGKSYFQSLELGEDSNDSSHSIKSMFQIGIVDCDQQTL
jgi:hypothetical protein